MYSLSSAETHAQGDAHRAGMYYSSDGSPCESAYMQSSCTSLSSREPDSPLKPSPPLLAKDVPAKHGVTLLPALHLHDSSLMSFDLIALLPELNLPAYCIPHLLPEGFRCEHARQPQALDCAARRELRACSKPACARVVSAHGCEPLQALGTLQAGAAQSRHRGFISQCM